MPFLWSLNSLKIWRATWKAFPANRGTLPYLLFALTLGLGYIIVEISLIQKFVVLLGQPVMTLPPWV